MFQKKTVIVVGAGASFEYKLPLGEGLTQAIANDVNIRFNDFGNRPEIGDEFIIQALRQAGPNINTFLPACRNIVAGMSEAQSIDTFINSRSGDKNIELVGKLGIVRSILRAERRSDLWIDPGNIYNTINFLSIQNTWLPKLRRFLFDGVSKDKVAERLNMITLIIFNYDRCVEHYLLHSFRNYYGIDEKEAIELLQPLTVIHPYGVVGSLPWQGGRDSIGFGEENLHGRLLALAGGIRTFTEQSEDDELSSQIRESVSKAGIMVFLGFAYHDQNIKLLTPESAGDGCHLFGTAVNISEPVQKVFKQKLAKAFGRGNQEAIHLDSGCECHQLFDKYTEVFAAF